MLRWGPRLPDLVSLRNAVWLATAERRGANRSHTAAQLVGIQVLSFPSMIQYMYMDLWCLRVLATLTPNERMRILS